VPSALTSICVVLPVTSALMVPLPLSYNLFATNCAKEVISAAVKTETVKSHSEVLKNPLVNLNEEIQRLEELLNRQFLTLCLLHIFHAQVSQTAVERLLPELRKKGVGNTKVSVRLADVLILPDGRKMIMDSEEGISGKYRSSALKNKIAF
jgi:hypothetical protein